MELPVVSTFRLENPEVVHDSVTALLSQQRNFDALSEQLLYLLRNGDTTRGFGRSVREFICGVLDLNRQTAGSEDIFRKANAGGSRSALRAAS